LTLRDVHCGSILRYLVASPEHLHQAIGIFRPRLRGTLIIFKMRSDDCF
jgi:hypothetical protein